MSTLIAISYRDETSAAAASEEALRQARELDLAPDAVAVVVRDGRGAYQITTNHQDLDVAASWGVFWRQLFGSLFFAASGSAGTDAVFRARIRALAQPGTSVLFLVVGSGTTDVVMDALARYGGIVLSSSLGTTSNERATPPAVAPGPRLDPRGAGLTADRARAPARG
jgi:uncharacterized membrane protein